MNSFLDLFFSTNELLFRACDTGNFEKVRVLLLKKDSDLDINWACKSNKYQTPLMVSSFKGYLTIVNLLLQEGARINHQDKDGQTALMKACVSHNNLDIIELLLNNGADVDIQDKRGWSALSRVAYSGNLSMVKLLVSRGANVNSQDKMGHTTLMRATEYQHLDVVDYLLQMGADVNIQNNYKSVALNYAQLPEIKNLLMHTASLQEWELIDEDNSQHQPNE